tara:strand:- start:6726 stop:7391 length:666 start_codon:yes stop_codon:yes gene_type:complete
VEESLNRFQYFILVFILVITIAGCGGDVPQQEEAMDELSILELTDPDEIAAWEASDSNFFHSKIKVVELRYFYGTLGNDEPKPLRTVAIEICEAQNNGITPEQQQALDDFVKNEKAIHAAVRNAIYQDYQKWYPATKEAFQDATTINGSLENIEEELPPIVDGTELDEITDFSQILIHPVIDGKVQIGIELFGKWDQLEGIGLRIQNEQIVDIGNAYEALP